MYYEEFFDGSDSNFSSEHPSTIFQVGHDDRQIVPRLGIEEKANDTITFIDVHEVKYQSNSMNPICESTLDTILRFKA